MRALLLVLMLMLCSLPWSNPVQARPGGGHSSSSHSSAFGSGGSSGYTSPSGGTLFGGNPSNGITSPGYGYGSGSGIATDILAFMILVGLIIIIVIIVKNQSQAISFTSQPTVINRQNQKSTINEALNDLKQRDPNFSAILFLDFVHLLYSKFYSYTSAADFHNLSPFLSSQLINEYQPASGGKIDEIVINGIHWQDISLDGMDTENISLLMDANYTQHIQNKRTRYSVTERWLFFRQKGLVSAGPEKMQTLSCPQCGAPAHFSDAGVCAHCGSTIQKGGMQWCLAKRVIVSRTAIQASDLVTYAKEQGTQLATVKATDLDSQMTYFLEQYAGTDKQNFWTNFIDNTVKATFLTIYQQWSLRNWQSVRHLVSDRLYEANLFWINFYLEHNWFNRLDNLKIENVEPVKIEVDKYYEAITVRIYAACNDYTEDANGKLLGGSKRELRRYSEYWTFARRTGMELSTAPYSLKNCPQCGAPADNMGQTAECGYCGSKISTGQFSWILFLIMQDDVYDG